MSLHRVHLSVALGVLLVVAVGCGESAGPVDEADGVSVADAASTPRDTVSSDTWTAPPDSSPPVPEPVTARVEVVSVVVGPGKSDGTAWDGLGELNDDVLTFMAAAAGLPYAEILGAVGGALFEPLAKPDPFGVVEIDRGRGWSDPQTFDVVDDTFLAQLAPRPTFSNVTLEDTRIQVEVFDEDFSNDDHVGVAILQPSDLLAAHDAGGDVWINVADQTQSQLLLVRVHVVP